MEIKTIKRPWINTQRKTSSPDSFYQSKYWRSTREIFRRGVTVMPDGYALKNIFCVDCYTEKGREVEGSQTDHVVQRKEGGTEDHDNLRTRCEHHHNVKSANEGNLMRKK